MEFQLHPRLTADTLEIDRWELSRVLLMRDANYPWIILVPQRPDVRRIHHLSQSDRILLMEEVVRVSLGLENLFSPDRINVGALGNIVEQLHVHLVARRSDDPAWPGPVWGAAPPLAYGEGEAESLARRLALAFAA